MSDARADIIVNVDTSVGIAQIKQLQRQISELNAHLLKSGAAQAQSAQNIQRNLINNINATGKFAAGVKTISSTAESFTRSLEGNRLSMGEYFRYAGASTKTFGRLFRNEFNTIQKVAESRVKTLQTQYIKLGRDANGALKAISVRPLALDMDNLATRTAIAAQKQQLFNQLLRQGSTNLLNFGKNTQWAGRQLMVGFTIPLMIMGTTAVREFRKIEEQAVKFRRVYGGLFTTGRETEEALKNVRALANEFTKYGLAVESTIDLAAKVAQMGNVGKALEEQVTQATRLSVLGGMEQMDALDTTVSLTNAFGVAIEDLAGKINFLNAAENQTILSISDFNTAVPLAGSVVRQLGGDVEDLAFFLTAMREGGINASQGGNALKSSLGRLIAPSRNAKETLGSFGIDVLGIVEANAGNLRGTIMQLGRELDRLDPLSRARSIEALFGKFQFARMSTLFQNINREGSQANKVLQLTTASAEELQIVANRELKAVEESPAFKLQKQIEDLKAALAPIGAEFIKLLKPIIAFITDLLKNFNNMGDGAKTFVVGLIATLGLIAPVALMTFGLMANGLANLIKLFALISRGIQGFGRSSTDLATSTTYMTQRQLEAQAVAASLDQSHARLIQTFGAESAAVDRLAAAYARATIAQRQLIAPTAIGRGAASTRGASGTPPLQLSSGIFSVPGPRGAGDIVPAMLSPGEAVIPADKSRKYAGLIRGVMNDDIPGYKDGRNPFDKSRIQSIQNAVDQTGTGLRVNKGNAPDIAEMLARVFGVRLSGGSTEVRLGDLRLNAKTSRGAQSLRDLIQRYLAAGIQEDRIARALQGAAERGRVTATELKKRLSMGRGPGITSAPKSLSNVVKPAVDPLFDAERRYIDNYLRRNNISVKDSQRANLLRMQLSHESMGPAGAPKDWSQMSRLYPDLGYVNNYLNRIGPTTQIGKQILGLSDDRLRRMGIDPKIARDLVNNGAHPRTAAQFNTLQRIARFDAKFGPVQNRYQAHALLAGAEFRSQNGFTSLRSVADLQRQGVITAELPKIAPPSATPGRAATTTTKSAPATTAATVTKTANRASAAKATSAPRPAIANLSSIISGNEDFLNQNIREGARPTARRPFFFSRFMRPIRLSSGIFSVPGPKGAGDIVPAMLSPGEAVIPVNQVKKYEGLISGILTDSIPGYSQGPGPIDPPRPLNPTPRQPGMPAPAPRPSQPPIPGVTAVNIGPEAAKDMGVATGKEMSRSRNIASGLREGATKGFRAASAATKDFVKNKVVGNIDEGRGLIGRLGARASVGLANYVGNEVVDAKGNVVNPGAAERAGALATRTPGTVYPSSSGKLRAIGADGKTRAATAAERKAYQQRQAAPAAPARGAAQAPAGEGRVRAVVGGTAMLAGMGAMAYGMSGGPGAEMASMAGMGLMMAPMLLPMLANPIVAVTAAIGGAVAGFIMLNNHLKKISKEAEEFTHRMGFSNSRLQDFAEASGKVTASDIMAERRLSDTSLLQIQAGKNTFGENFLRSDAGKEMLQDVESGIASLGRSQTVAKVKSQLAAAVASGALDVSQARSIAASLAKAMGDLNFGMSINASLTKIFGPNGEDLAKDPLRVSLMITDIAEKDFNAAIKSYQNTLEKFGTPGGFLNPFATEEQRDTSVGLYLDSLSDVITSNAEKSQKGLSSWEAWAEGAKRALDIPGNIQKAIVNATAGVTGFFNKGLDVNLFGLKFNIAGGLVSDEFQAGMDETKNFITAGTSFDKAEAYFKTEKKALELVAEERGKLIGILKQTTSAYQQALDVADVLFDREINAAKAAGDSAKVQALEAKRLSAREEALSRFVKANKNLTESFTSLSEATQRDLSKDLDTSILDRIDDKDVKAAVKRSLEELDRQVSSGAMSAEISLLLKTQVESGTLPPTTLNAVLGMVESGGEVAATRIINIIPKVNPRDLNNVLQVSQLFFDKDGKPNKTALNKFLFQIDSAGSQQEIDNILGVMNRINALSPIVGESVAQSLAKGYTSSSKSMQELLDKMKLVDDISKKEFKIEVIQELLGDDVAGVVAKDQEYFNSLDPVNKVVYLQVLATMALPVMSGDIDAQVRAWAMERGKLNFGSLTSRDMAILMPQLRQEYLRDQSWMATMSNMLTGTGGQGASTGTGVNPLDSIVKRLKQVRDAAINAAGGIKTLRDLLGGSKNIFKFTGIEQQLSKKGFGQGFIDFISALDPEEAKKFYTVNRQGALQLTKDGKIVKDAFDEIALGDFQLKQQRTIDNIKNQGIAFAKLTSAGISVADAYEAIADSSLAAAVANGKLSPHELKQLATAAREAATAQKEYNDQMQRTLLIAENKERIGQDKSILDFVNKNIGNLNQALFDAITRDPVVRELVRKYQEGVITQLEREDLEKILRQIVEIDELEISLGKIAFKTKEEAFSEGLSNVMRQFAAQEQKIELGFAAALRTGKVGDLIDAEGLAKELRAPQAFIEKILSIKDPVEVVRLAQNEIATIDFFIDDLEAELRRLEDQEEEINKKYDDRLEALDKIEKANAQVAQQQRMQLDVADAISRGDIAAAARAIEELRARKSEDAAKQNRDRLEKARESELGALRSSSGKSRIEIEKEIKDLQRQIFEIEEERLEPARELIRLADIQKEKNIDGLTVLGQTREAWESITNAVDLAVISTETFQEAMREALRIGQGVSSGTVTGDQLTARPPANVDAILNPAPPSNPSAPLKTKLSDGRSIEVFNGRRAFRAKRGESLKDLDPIMRATFGPSVPQLTVANIAELKDGNRNGEYLYSNQLIRLPQGFARGGLVSYRRLGGLIPYKAQGGLFKTINTDSVPAMLTPGEFVIRRSAVDRFGVDNLKAVNNGTYQGGSVYNYEVNVNVRSEANPDQIARAVMTQIKQVNAQKIRGGRF